QRLEAQLVHQVVGAVQAAKHAELLLEDAPHVLASEGADAVVGGRAVFEALLEALLLGGAERPVASAARKGVQGGQAGGVVAGDPGADLALRQQHLLCDGRRGLAQERQADGAEAARPLGARLRADQPGQLLSGVMRLDVHWTYLRCRTSG